MRVNFLFFCFIVIVSHCLVVPGLSNDFSNGPVLNNARLEDSDKRKEQNFKNLITHKNSILHEYIVVFRSESSHFEIERYFTLLKKLQIEFNNKIEHYMDEYFTINDYLRGHFLRTNSDEKLIPILLKIPIIKFIECNSVIKLNSQLIQNNTSWGLARISQKNRLKIFDEQKYYYDSNGQGENVDVYILDTGINVLHKQFDQRVTWGKTIPPNEINLDNNGHGTHCAGIVGSKEYGVAKKANLIAVKILDSKGDGEMSDLIKGIEYVSQQHINNTKNNSEFKGSVINLSIGAEKSFALDLTIHAATELGVHVVVAAGNEDEDACSSSPSDSTDAITVGAMTFSDYRAFFSNWGKCVDIFAPGFNIMSTWIGPQNNEIKSLTGTSMASPFVAGLAAYLLSLLPEKSSQFNVNYNSNELSLVMPLELRKMLLNLATKDILNDIPDGTPNLMAYNGKGENLTISEI